MGVEHLPSCSYKIFITSQYDFTPKNYTTNVFSTLEVSRKTPPEVATTPSILQDLKASQLVADQVAYNSCTVAAGEVACKKMEG